MSDRYKIDIIALRPDVQVPQIKKTITFTPTQTRTLYYHSGSHSDIGGTINVVQPPVSSITFTPTQTRTLYYHCGNHENMGNVINVTSNVNYQLEIFAGELGTSGNQDGPLSSATFAGIKGLDCDMNGGLYVSCYDGHTIRKIENNVVQTVLGNSILQVTLMDRMDYYPNHMVYVLINIVIYI